ncbi:DUF6745 domain-containing protein [Nostoc sp. 'Peltigera malacea cyanobiont' DB3992]|uniref:DUF6745 domain-containing protein n=1 Tax=Nostoc sp. 'Peltigera malacea cyanobiont' DB3992 TaxID=1206980 RepID=UPI00117CDD67|nr:hypothetical protein [Nostoc sp. 'Peltigera malacea cyanobiont' DB3992]
MPRRTNDMPKLIITELSDEQEAMLPIYRDKWRSIQISTESIEQEKVAAVIKAAYAVSDYPEPEILFYSSPMTAIENILTIKNFKAYLGRDIHIKFGKRVIDHLLHGITQQLDEHLCIRLRNQVQHPEFPYYSTESHPLVSYFPYTGRCLKHQLIADLDKLELEFTDILYFTNNLTRPAEWAIWGCMLDFCISVLNLQHDKKKWNVVQELMQHCGLIFQFEKVCIVCDRPCKLSFDEENMLHAEEEAALQFADAYSVYACHARHPSQEERYYEEQDPDSV